MPIYNLRQSIKAIKCYYKHVAILMCLGVIPSFSNAKSYEFFKTEIYADNQIRVEVEFKLYNTICSDLKKSNKYTYIVTGQLYNYTKSVNWKLKYIDCNGNLQIEDLKVFIGGNDAVLGRIESLDQRFVGYLDTKFNNFYIEAIIEEIEGMIANNQFLEAKTELENKKSIINDSDLVNKEYSRIYDSAQHYYIDSLNSTSLIDKKGLQLASILINEAEKLFFDLPENISSKKKELELIYQEQKRIEIRNEVDKLIKQNNVLRALITYNENINIYRSHDLEKTLIDKAEDVANNSFSSNDYNYAIKVYRELYKHTEDQTYLSQIRKCEEKIEEQEIVEIHETYIKLKQDVKQNKSISNFENLYNFENKYDFLSSKYSIKNLNKLWSKKIKTYHKKGNENYKVKDYREALNNFNESIDLLDIYASKSYSSNYTSSLEKFTNKVTNRKSKTDRIVNYNSSSQLDLLKNKYEKKKLKHKVVRLGISYDLIQEPVNSFDSYINDPAYLEEDLINIYNNFSTSKLSAFLTYDRIGLFAGNLITTELEKSYDLGLYLRLFGNFYGKFGYSAKNTEAFYINNLLPNSVTGIAFIGNGLNIETSYNNRYRTVQFGIGFNIYKRISKKRYKYLKSITK